MAGVCAAAFTAFTVAYSGYFFTHLARHIGLVWRESGLWSRRAASAPAVAASAPEEEAEEEEGADGPASAVSPGPEQSSSSTSSVLAPAGAAAEGSEGASSPQAGKSSVSSSCIWSTSSSSGSREQLGERTEDECLAMLSTSFVILVCWSSALCVRVSA
ncbi:uncharacterized protein GJ701_016926 isoform 2-T2 [Geothlypis trichas]